MLKKGLSPTPIVIKHKVNTQLWGFTLLELTIVIVIIGILATLGLTRYSSYKETTLDKEVQANLRLILSAERIFRIESSVYFDSGTAQPQAITNINTTFRLLLSTASNRNWNYLTTADNNAVPPKTCAQATRVNGPNSRTWRMRNTEDNPVSGGTCP